MNLILLGAPGAGKGTQGALLAEKLGIPKVATGDILREAVRGGTDLGRRAQGFMDAGELVPDEVILGLVREALTAPEAERGAIFDGFPRTLPQAEGVDALLAELGREVDRIVVIEVPEDAIVRRMSGRRIDPDTGEVYHLEHNPPPAAVADRVVQRVDDREDTVRHRIRVYEENTAPLIAHYEERGVRVERVRGDRAIDAVQQELLNLVGAAN
jgi:adenylate kinase